MKTFTQINETLNKLKQRLGPGGTPLSTDILYDLVELFSEGGLLASGQNIGTVNSDVATVVEAGNAFEHISILTLKSGITQTIAGADLSFGKKLYDFPAGGIKCKRAHLDLTLTAATETAVGEVGLGTVVGEGAVTTLGGTATFEDIVDGFANTAITSTGAKTQAYKECEAGILDGSTTAKDLYLNLAGGWTSSEDITIAGTIVLFWDFLPDHS